MAKLWPPAALRVNRRTLFKSAAGVLAAGFAGEWLLDKFLARDEPSATSLLPPVAKPLPGTGATFVDVREFKKSMTVEALNTKAEAYFARLKTWDFHLAKPLWNPDGTPELLTNFAHLLRGLQLLPGMTVVDFGAGSCWASRWLSQMGMEAIALDVSATALKIGQELYARLPVIGQRPPPRFLVFDGHRIDLPDASVDRILCFDTFHHLLNPDEVLREMSRILKPGGIAGFSEPGPKHSSTPQSQFEMRNFQVLEDDVRIGEIWFSARKAGFQRIRLAVFTVPTYAVGLAEFEEFLGGATAPGQRFLEATRAQMHDRRMFFLQKGGEPPMDSRTRGGLNAKLQVALTSVAPKEGSPLTARAVVTNTGKAIWLPHSAGAGGVELGIHLLDASGTLLEHGYVRHPLTPGAGRTIAPGETVTLDLRIPKLPKGRHVLEFDLISRSVVWFSVMGVDTVRLPVEVN
jgi:SAM-dependent methyltransferase